MAKNKAIFGIYRDRSSVEEAVEVLHRDGFRATDISVLFQDNQGTKDLAHEKHTKAPEGATTGGVLGGIVGGVLGGLTAAGIIAVPQLGPLVAAGPIVAAFAGAGALGTLGGVVGALVGLEVPEYEAKRYEGRIKRGGALLSVHCDNDDWVHRAKTVLRSTGAEQIGVQGEASADFSVSDRPLPRARTAAQAGITTINDPLTLEEEVVPDEYGNPKPTL